MKRAPFGILVLALAGLVVYLNDRFDDLDMQLVELRSLQAKTCEKTLDVADSPPPKVEPPVKRSPPSRNPAADITGSSARVFQSRSRATECRRSCRFISDCLVEARLCPDMQTDSTLAAAQRCVEVCKKNKAVKDELLEITGCPQSLPPSLSFICPKSI